MKQVPDSAVYMIPNPQQKRTDGRDGAEGVSLPELDLLARWMDTVFHIPGTKLRFGLDSLLGLIPGLGDTATSLVSLYILQAANRQGVSRVTMARMAFNVIVDFAVGAIPFAGDVFDFYWKSNQKNVELLRRDLEANPTTRRQAKKEDWLFFAGLAAILIAVLVGCVTITYFLLYWLGAMFAKLMG